MTATYNHSGKSQNNKKVLVVNGRCNCMYNLATVNLLLRKHCASHVTHLITGINGHHKICDLIPLQPKSQRRSRSLKYDQNHLKIGSNRYVLHKAKIN